MNRYKFSEDNIKKAIKYVLGKTKTGPAFAKKFKDELKVKKKKLYYLDREVISLEKVDDLLRTKVYKEDDTPTGRDSFFHIIKQNYIGVSRRVVMEFLRKQKPLEDKPSVPQARQKSGKKFKNYVFEVL